MSLAFTIVAFIIILGFMVFIHELGHFVMAKLARIRVEEFAIGFPPRVWGFRRGETEYALNLLPLGGYVRMTGEDDPSADERSFAAAKKRWRVGVLVAGSLMNLLAAGLLFALAYAVGYPTPTEYLVGVGNVAAGSPAEAGGLKPGDVITSVNGQPLKTPDELRAAATANAGQPISLGVTRTTDPSATPPVTTTTTLSVTPRQNPPAGQGALGIVLQPRVTKTVPIASPPGEALSQGFARLGLIVRMTFDVPRMAFNREIDPGLARPVGPAGIFQITGVATEEASRSGTLIPLLELAGILGAGLGIANLLPIPGLDGGRLLFILIEAVRGRRVDPRREGFFHLAGFVFLIGMVLIITFFDITNPITSEFGRP